LNSRNPKDEKLSLLLQGYFEQPLSRLPKKIRMKVEEIYIAPWGALTPLQREQVASDYDIQKSPTELDQRLFRLPFEIRDLEKKRQVWNALTCTTASELAARDKKLNRLKSQIEELKKISTVRRGRSKAELPEDRRTRLCYWFEEEKKAKPWGALQRVADMEGVSRQTLRKILDR
jgi:septal ring factor EnvC (AmiA/AmiB activator)